MRWLTEVAELIRLAYERQERAKEYNFARNRSREASKGLAEFAFTMYQERGVTMEQIAQLSGIPPDDFRALMLKHIGKQRLWAARRKRRGLPYE